MLKPPPLSGVPIFRSQYAQPLFVRAFKPSIEHPKGYILIGRDIDTQALLFDAQLTDKDKKFLSALHIEYIKLD